VSREDAVKRTQRSLAKFCKHAINLLEYGFWGSDVIGVTTKSSNMIILMGEDSILSYLRWSCNEILISFKDFLTLIFYKKK
jgi:hypothetical protein